jgi:hypothetical protein
MQEIFVQIVFGWPFIILSLLLAVAGVLTKRPGLMIAGAAFYLPPAWSLRGFLFIRWAVIILPALIVSASLYVKRGNTKFAWVLLTIPILVSLFLALWIISQNMGIIGG